MTTTYAYLTGQPGSPECHDQFHQIVTYVSTNGLLGPIQFLFETTDHGHLKLANLVAKIKHGDSLVVAEWSTLGGSIREIVNTLSTLIARGVQVWVVSSNFRIDNSIHAKVIASACTVVTQIETELASASQTPEIVPDQSGDALSPKPAPRTRKSCLDPKKNEIHSLLQSGATYANIARQIGANRQTVADYIVSRNLTG